MDIDHDELIRELGDAQLLHDTIKILRAGTWTKAPKAVAAGKVIVARYHRCQKDNVE